MAGKGKGSNVYDQAIQERRLRPAYDFLDRGNHKRVIQEVDRLLKKQPDFQCAKAIKALALLRIGHVADCQTIIDALVSETPTEDNTIQALTICFRELGQPRMVCTILENASKIDKSEDLLSSCFMANVRVSEFQKQYQVAINLYKLYPKSPYFAWAVMSLFVKAEFDPDPSSRISLPLAEKMMSKFFDEKNHIESDHEISLYILLLQRLKNYKKILTIIDRLTTYKTSVLTGLYYRIKIECIQMTEDSATTAKFLESIILKNLGEWSYYETYITHFGLIDSTAALEFLDSLDKFLPGSPSTSRAILLSPLFLYSHLVKNNSTNVFDPIRHLRKYLFYYGRLPSFFADIEPFFASLTTQEMKLKIIEIVGDDLAEDREEFKLYAMLQPQQANDTQGKVNCCYTKRYIQPFTTVSLDDDNERIRSTFAYCVNEYMITRAEQKYYEAKSPRKDDAHDSFINVAALTLIDKFWSYDSDWSWTSDDSSITAAEDPYDSNHSKESLTNNSVSDKDVSQIVNGMSRLHLENQQKFVPNQRDIAPLLALSILQYCLEMSPTSSQTRLLLGKLYFRCGASMAGLATFGPLDLKHCMLASTSYLYTGKLISCANYEQAFRSINGIETFFSTFEKEGMEHVLSAYKYGSWEKVLEFIKFRDHLLNSSLRPFITVERMLLEYCTSQVCSYPKAQGNSGNIENDILNNLDQLTDTRDFELIDTFKPRPKSSEWKERSFAAEKTSLRVRSLVASLLSNTILILEHLRAQEPHEGELTKLEELVTSLDLLVTTRDYTQYVMNDVTIDVMWPPRISQYVSGPCLEYLMDLFRLTIEVGKNQINANFLVVNTKLHACIKAVLDDENVTNLNNLCILDVANIFEKVTELIETLSFSCVVLDLISFMVKNCTRKARKKRSKPQVPEVETVDETQIVELINSTSDAFKMVSTSLRTLTETLTNNYSKINSSNLASFWRSQVPSSTALYDEILREGLSRVLTKLRSSYIHSTTTLIDHAQCKIQQLEKLSKGFEPSNEAS